MVFYRKYRPQTIDDLDKEDVRKRLLAIFSKPELPHAFLFTGPKGTGKTSTARIIAKIVNCLAKRDPASSGTKSTEPCNDCSNCKTITNGSFVDVIEIDAASNRGIDEIRDLRERITYAPAIGKKKVYIIDEVHMLTREAFNALLKTLEEPPTHVLFILATTELHKLPDTIVSRCTGISFTKATPSEIARSLARVVTGEKLKIRNEVLIALANQADGSFRDATKLLEQLVSESNGKSISKDTIEQFTGSFAVEQFISLVTRGEMQKALQLLEDEETHGTDFQEFTKRILDKLHVGLLSKYGQGTDIPPALEKVPVLEIQALIKLFSSAYQEIKVSYIEQMPLELAAIEWGERKKAQLRVKN